MSRRGEDAELVRALVACRERSGVSLGEIAAGMALSVAEVARFEIGQLPLTVERARLYAAVVGGRLADVVEVDGHRAVAVKGALDGRYGPPAEVCEKCTDWEAGRLVPASFCTHLRLTGLTAELDTNPPRSEDPDEQQYLTELWRLRHAGKSDDECAMILFGRPLNELT